MAGATEHGSDVRDHPQHRDISMPRAANAKLYLFISPASLASATQIAPRHVYQAIDAGHLVVKILPGTRARRIAIGPPSVKGTAEFWYRHYWLKAAPTTKRRTRSSGRI
jgi:hypothetical protein